MSLPSIGAHCTVSTCNLNDFLPIRCPACDHLFCKEHIFPDQHDCTHAEATPSTTEAQKKLQRCAANHCTKPSLEAFVADDTRADSQTRTPAVCSRCQQAFCAIHREPASHACTAPDPTRSTGIRNEAAHALLAKHFPSSDSAVSGSTSSVTPAAPVSKAATTTNPKKAAQIRQVELMKMRHKAQPGDPKDNGKSVAVDQRLHVKVRSDENESEKAFWFRKTVGTGKALDLLAAQLGVKSGSAPLHLVKTFPGSPDDAIVLANDQLLAGQVEDGSQLLISRRV